MRVVSKKIRNAARGQDCTLRLPGCSFDPEQTVGAHVPCGHSGMGLKSPETMMVFACRPCHALIDGSRRHEFLTDILRALAETHVILIGRELLKVEGMR